MQRALECVSCNQLQLQVEFITVIIVSWHNVLIASIEQIVIIITIRANIESSYGHKVSELRMQYTQEDKEMIEKFLKAKRSKSEILMEREDLSGNSINICSSP